MTPKKEAKKTRTLADLKREADQAKEKAADEAPAPAEIAEDRVLEPVTDLMGEQVSGTVETRLEDPPAPEGVSLEVQKPKGDEDFAPPGPRIAVRKWTFLSRLKGYSFPDPRDKPPADPHLSRIFTPRIIQFMHGVYQTTDQDEAAAMYRRYKTQKERGVAPDFQPIDADTANRYRMKNQPNAGRGPVSSISAKAVKVDHREITERGLDDEFAPAPK